MRSPFLFASIVAAVLALSGAPAHAGVLISIDKSAQRMTVAVDGVARYHWPISTGKAGYSTPSGSYTPFRLEEDHFSKEWDDAPMPYSIFFTKIGHAIHGSFETKGLGSPASHGCVRLAPANAATLFKLVKEEGLSNTKVVLTGTEPAAAPLVAKRSAPRPAAREPLSIAPELYGRAPSETYGARLYPDQQAGRSAVDDYAARMRQRYYDERAPVQRYYEPPAYPSSPYSRGGYPYGWN